MKLILLGPPGAGKGTQADVLSQHFNIPHISTGDMFRETAKTNTPVGIKIKQIMDSGQLIPDDIVIKIVVERFKKSDTQKGFILDGFPRTIAQAEALDYALNQINLPIDLVMYFKTQTKVILSRLTGRRVCKKCGFNYHIKNIPPKKSGICDKCGGALYQRDDDKKRTVLKRIKVYEKQTAPLIDYYKQKGILREVSGDLEVNKLFKHLIKLFEKETIL